jgi:hypothetical protein
MEGQGGGDAQGVADPKKNNMVVGTFTTIHACTYPKEYISQMRKPTKVSIQPVLPYFWYIPNDHKIYQMAIYYFQWP